MGGLQPTDTKDVPLSNTGRSGCMWVKVPADPHCLGDVAGCHISAKPSTVSWSVCFDHHPLWSPLLLGVQGRTKICGELHLWKGLPRASWIPDSLALNALNCAKWVGMLREKHSGSGQGFFVSFTPSNKHEERRSCSTASAWSLQLQSTVWANSAPVCLVHSSVSA